MNAPPSKLDNEVPCAGRWDLFDSTDQADHLEARAMCDACPALTWCRDYARNVAETAPHIDTSSAMTGTWAGLLYGRQGHRAGTPGRGKREVLPLNDIEEGMTADEVRRAASAYRRGDRSEWACKGRRIYNRHSDERRTSVAESATRGAEKRDRIAREDATFSDEDARSARAAHNRGDRSEWAVTGYRVYQRRNRQRARARKATGAAA